MFIRKKRNLYIKDLRPLATLTRRVLHVGLTLILLSLLRLWWEITHTADFSLASAARFGEMLEYAVAALALLTAGTYLIEKVSRAEAS